MDKPEQEDVFGPVIALAKEGDAKSLMAIRDYLNSDKVKPVVELFVQCTNLATHKIVPDVLGNKKKLIEAMEQHVNCISGNHYIDLLTYIRSSMALGLTKTTARKPYLSVRSYNKRCIHGFLDVVTEYMKKKVNS